MLSVGWLEQTGTEPPLIVRATTGAAIIRVVEAIKADGDAFESEADFEAGTTFVTFLL